ncbi:MAG TPA: branched-chain amino acid ABC transporter permease/ATP-binding protein [Acidimicrobiales bacterium]|jgi:sulfate-transporting ATPase
MNEIIGFAILGIGTGGLYVLGALGLVIVYRGSRTINFAQGAMATTSGYAYWQLHDVHQWPFALAFIIAIALAAALGVLTHRLVMVPLRDSSLLTKIVASLAILSILEIILSIKYPQADVVVEPFLPQGSWHLSGIEILKDHVIILALGVVLTVGLWAVYKSTRFGLWTTAVSENREIAGSVGISPDFVGTINWGVGCGLAGVTGIFLAPITGLQVTTYTELIVPMLAAAVIGSFQSFPLTLAGGLFIGMAESELNRYGPSSVPGLGYAVPFVVVAIVLLVRGSRISVRGDVASRLPSLGSGRISKPLVVTGIAIALIAIWTLGASWDGAITSLILVALILLSVVIVTGYAGQISLAQFTFCGLGALAMGQLVGNHGWPLWAGILVGTASCIPVGFLVGLAGVRARGVTLAIVTLGFAVAVDSVVFSNGNWTGNEVGITIPSTVIFGVNVTSVTFPQRFGTFALIAFVLVALATANLRRGRTGRRLIAVRGNERAAASLGISVVGAKLYAFTLGAAIASFGGILLALTYNILTYGNEQYGALQSVGLLQQSVIGGVGWNGGTLIGGSLQPGSIGSRIFSFLGSNADEWVQFGSAILLVLIVVVAQDGAAAHQAHLVARIRKRLGISQAVRSSDRSLETLQADAGSALPPPKCLTVENLSVHYGGVSALSGLSLTVSAGQIVGLIGPNGAGKTTLIDAISGFAPISGGQVLLDGVDIAQMSPAERSKSGIGRSFQALELFADMTVSDNILVASEPRDRRAYLQDLVHPGKAGHSSTGLSAVKEFGLEAYMDTRPGELPHGRQRLVAIARAVAAAPSILLLDEPAGGLDDVETAQLADLVRRLADEWGIGVLLIEHNVDMVLNISDVVHVVDFGHPIASGTSDEVRKNPRVIDAYLGHEEVI